MCVCSWFAHAEDDAVIGVEETDELMTALLKEGASDVHYSRYPSVSTSVTTSTSSSTSSSSSSSSSLDSAVPGTLHCAEVVWGRYVVH